MESTAIVEPRRTMEVLIWNILYRQAGIRFGILMGLFLFTQLLSLLEGATQAGAFGALLGDMFRGFLGFSGMMT